MEAQRSATLGLTYYLVNPVPVQRRTTSRVKRGAILQGGNRQHHRVFGLGPFYQRIGYRLGNGSEALRDVPLPTGVWTGFGAAAVENEAPARGGGVKRGRRCHGVLGDAVRQRVVELGIKEFCMGSLRVPGGVVCGSAAEDRYPSQLPLFPGPGKGNGATKEQTRPREFQWVWSCVLGQFSKDFYKGRDISTGAPVIKAGTTRHGPSTYTYQHTMYIPIT